MQKFYYHFFTAVTLLLGSLAFGQNPDVTVTYPGGDICSGDNAIFQVDVQQNGSAAAAPFDVFYSVNGGSAQSINYTAFGQQNITVNNVTGETTLRVDSIEDNNGVVYTFVGESATLPGAQVNPIPTKTTFSIVSGKNNVAEGDDFEFNYAFSSGTAPFTITFEIENVVKTVVAPSNSGVVTYNEAGINDVVGTYDIDYVKVEDANGCESSPTQEAIGSITVNPKPEIVSYTLQAGPNGGTVLNNTHCEDDVFRVDLEFSGSGNISGEYDVIFFSGNPAVAVTRINDAMVNAMMSGGSIVATLEIPTDGISNDVDSVRIDFSSLTADLGGGQSVMNNDPKDSTDFRLGEKDIFQDISVSLAGFNDVGNNFITEICDGEELNVDASATNERGTANFTFSFNGTTYGPTAEVAGDELTNLEGTPDYVVGNNTITITQVSDEACTQTPLPVPTDNVTVNPNPTVDFDGPGALCQNDNYTFNIQYTGTPNYDLSFRITDGGALNYTFPTLTNTTVGSFTFDPNNYDGANSMLVPGTTYQIIAVSLSDDNGCSSNEAALNESISFLYKERPTATASFADSEICSGTTTSLDFIMNGLAPYTVVVDSMQSTNGGLFQNLGQRTYQVSTDNFSLPLTPVSNTNIAVYYRIRTIQDGDNCGNTYPIDSVNTDTITIYPNPAIISITQLEDSVCNNNKNDITFQVQASGSNDYIIRGTISDNQGDNYTFEYDHDGPGSTFTFSLNQAINSVAPNDQLKSGRTYTITFTEIEDERNTGDAADDCTSPISGQTFTARVFRLPDVSAFDIVESDNIANPVSTICFGDDAKLLFNIEAFGRTTLNLNRVSTVNPSLNGPVTVVYPGLANGPLTTNYPNQEFLVSPLDSVTYELVQISSQAGNLTCSRALSFGPEPLHVNDLPVGEISLNTSEVCIDNNTVDVVVTVSAGDDAAGFQYDIVNDGNSITRLINNPIPRSRTSTITVSDSSYIYLRNLQSQNTPTCFGQDDSIFVFVNQQPDVELLTADTFVCQGNQAGFRVSLTGVAPFELEVFAESAPATGSTQTISLLSAENGNYVNNREVFVPVTGIAFGGDTAFTITSIEDAVCVNNDPTSDNERVIIVVNRNPSLSISAPALVCYNTPNPLTTVVRGGNANDYGLVQEVSLDYSISYKNGGVFSAANFNSVSATNQNRTTAQTFSLTRDTSFVVTAVSESTFGCVGTAGQEFAVNVLDEITGSISAPDTVCNGDNLPVTVSLPTGIQYQLNFRVNGVNQLRNNVVDGQVLTFNTGGGNVRDTVILLSAAFQNGQTCTTTINDTVSSLEQEVPEANIDPGQGDIQVCRFSSATFTVTFTAGTGTIFMDYATTGGNFAGTISGTAGQTKTVTVAGLPVGSYTFERKRVYTVSDNGECDGNAVGGNTANITVRDLPQVSFVPNKTNVCDNEPVTFAGTFSNSPNSTATEFDVIYQINAEPNDTVTLNPSLGNDDIIISRVGSYSIVFKKITERNGNGVNCPNSINQNFNINVNQRPTVAFTGATTICEQKSTALNFDFTGTAPFNVALSNFGSFTAFQDTSILVSPANTTTYQITSLTDGSGAGCAGALGNPSVTVTVIDKPTVNFTLSANPICEGQTVNMNLTFTGGTAPEYEVQYQINNNPIITHPTASTGGNLSISLPAFNQDAAIKLVRVTDNSSPSCVFTENITRNLEVRQTPSATFIVSEDEICENEAIQVGLQITGRPGKNIAYEVVDNGANIVQTGVAPAGSTINFGDTTLDATTTFSLSYLRYNDNTPACNNPTASKTVIVNPEPTIALTGGGIYCQGQPVPYNIDYLTGSGNIFVELNSPQTNQTINVNSTAGNTVPYTWIPNDTGNIDLGVVSITSVSGTGVVCQNTTNVPADLNHSIRPTPSADINANQFTIVNGGQTQLIFSGTGYKGAGAGNVIIEYTANGTPQSPNVSLDGNPQFPDTTMITVSPTVTTTYSITQVRQNSGAVGGSCSTDPNAEVTITVVDNKTAAISGDDNICLGECVELYFSFDNPTPDYDVVIVDNTAGIRDTLFNVNDNTPVTYCPPVSGSLNLVIAEVTDAFGNNTTDPNEFAGVATIDVSESKTVRLIGDTTICEGTNGAFTAVVEGSGEFTIPFSVSPSGTQRIFSISENDSPSRRTVLASELQLGLNVIRFNGLPTNSLSNSCPIDTVGEAYIRVKPTPSGDFTFNPVKPCEGSTMEISLDASPDSVFDVNYTFYGTAKSVSGVQDNGLLESFTASANGRITLTRIAYSDLPACANNTIVQKDIQIKQAPVVAFPGADAQICNGQDFNIVVRLTEVDKFPVSFTYNDGTQDSTITFFNRNNLLDTVITVSPTVTTTYTLVDVSDGNTPACNGSVAIGQEDITVTVGAPLILNDFRIAEDTICNGENTTFVVDVNGDLPMTAFFSGSQGSFTRTLTNTGVNIFPLTPSADVTLRLDRIVDSENCELLVNQTRELQVIQKPTLSYTANRTSLCLGDSSRLRVTVSAEDTVIANFRATNPAALDTNYILAPGTQFVWLKPKQAGDPLIITVETISYKNPRGGCITEDVQPTSFRVYSTPTASIFINPNKKDTIVCQNTSITLRFEAPSSGDKTVFFQNDRGPSGFVDIPSGSVSATRVVTPLVGMNKYYISQVTRNTNGTICSATVMDTVYVEVAPTPTVEITTTNNPRCLNGPASTIKFNFTGNGPFIFDYTDGTNTITRTATVDSDNDGRLDVVVSVSPGTTTTYCVTRIQDATSPTACVNLSANCKTISVNQQPEAELFNGNDEVCQGECVTLNYFLRGRAPIDVRFTFNGTAAGLPNISGDTLLLNRPTGLNTLTLCLPNARDYIITIDSIADNNNPTCTSGATVGFAEVVVNPTPSVNTFALDFMNLCQGETARLNVIPNAIGGQFDYPYEIRYLANGTVRIDTITQAASFIEVTPNVTTTYRLRAIKSINTGCDSVYSPVNPFVQTLNIYPNPTIDFQVDPSNICVGDNFTLDVVVKGTPSFLFDVYVNGNLFAVNQLVDGPANANGEFVKSFTYSGAPLAPTGFNRSFITIQNVRDNSSGTHGTPNDCVTNPTDTAFFQVNPQATANFANTNTLTVCETDSIDFEIDITGSGTVFAVIEVRRVSDNGLIRRDTVTGLASVGQIIYRDSPNQNVRYDISSVFSRTGGVQCPGAPGNSVSVNVRNTPVVSISFDNETVCEGDEVEVTYTIAGQGPFDFVRTIARAGQPDSVSEFFSEFSPVVEFVRLTDSAIFYVDTIIRRQAPFCFNTDSVGKRLNVNPKASATMVKSDTTFCEGLQPGFEVSLEGEGPITILYRRMPSGPIQTYTNFAGTYFIPVTQTVGTTARWQVISIDDQSNPRCVESSGRGFTDITVIQKASANISGDFEICEGANAALNITITGQFDDQIVVFYSDKLNPGVGTTATGTYTNFPGNYGVLVTGLDTNRHYTVDSVRYQNLGCTVPAAEFVSVDTARISVRPTPEAGITVPDIDVCKFEDIDFTFNFPYPGPYSVSYSINGAPTVTENDVNDGHVVTVLNAPDTTDIVIRSLVYRDIPQCVAEDVDSLTVNVNDTLIVSIFDTLCNATATGYRFVVDIVGGKADSYVFINNGGTPVALQGPRDTLPELPNGAYNFVVTDQSGCPEVPFVGSYQCDCISMAGEFTNTTDTLKVCEDGLAQADPLYDNSNEVLDANDTLVYVLHDNAGPTLGTILAVSSTANFIRGTLPTNVTYYISAVVGDANPAIANGFNRNDRCLSVSPGVPVVFLRRSTIEIELLPNDSGFFCTDNLLRYQFRFTSPAGPTNGDFTVTWNDGTGPDRSGGFSGTSSGPITSDQPATVTPGTFDIISFVDADNMNNCYTPLNSGLTYDLEVLPDPSFVNTPRVCGDKTVDSADVATYSANATGPVRYNWSFTDGTPATGTMQNMNVQYAIAGTKQVKLIVTNEFGCRDSSSQTTVVTIPTQPVLDNDLSSACVDDIVQFATSNIVFTGPGQNSDSLYWYFNGALIESGQVNVTNGVTLANRGLNTITIVNYFNGCTVTQRRTFTVNGGVGQIELAEDFLCKGDSLELSIVNGSGIQRVDWRVEGNGAITRTSTTAPYRVFIRIPRGFPIGDQVNVFAQLVSPEGCITDRELLNVTVYDVQVSIEHQVPDQEGLVDPRNPQQYCFGYLDSAYFENPPVGATSFQWNFGGQIVTGPNPAPQFINKVGNTSIVLTGTDDNGCTDVDSVNFEIKALPTISIETNFGQDTVCTGNGQVTLEVLGVGTNPATAAWEWTTDPTIVTALDQRTVNLQNPLPEGVYNYTVIARDQFFCYDTTTTEISSFELDDPININKFVDLDTTFAIGYELSVDYGLGNPAYIYSWDPIEGVELPGFGITDILTLEDETYTLTVTDAYGCFEARSVDVNINLLREATIDVPDAFTPNGDGINDFIFPDGWALSEVLEFSVYNRNGNLVWMGTGSKEDAAWDGTYKGKVQPADTYYYTVRVRTILGTEILDRGQFSIIR